MPFADTFLSSMSRALSGEELFDPFEDIGDDLTGELDPWSGEWWISASRPIFEQVPVETTTDTGKGKDGAVEPDPIHGGAPTGGWNTEGPFMVAPVPGGTFSNDWGAPRVGHTHQGNDIMAPTGTPIYAVRDGRATYSEGGTCGGTVYLYTDAGYMLGCHLIKAGKTGKVKAGDIIGYVGGTGNASPDNPHLHFEWHPGGTTPGSADAVNPYNYLTQVYGSGASMPERASAEHGHDHGKKEKPEKPEKVQTGQVVTYERKQLPRELQPGAAAMAPGLYGQSSALPGALAALLSPSTVTKKVKFPTRFALPDDDPKDLKGGGGSVEENIELAKRLAASRFGWTGEQWKALYELWSHESGFDHQAANPSSSARGIPQSMMSVHFGDDWDSPSNKAAQRYLDSPYVQIMWGLTYIKNRDEYGSPLAAWQHFQQHGSY